MLCRNIAALCLSENVLRPVVPYIQPSRTTFILKRRTPPPLVKKGRPPRALKPRHYVYDLVEDTSRTKKENLDVVLTTYVKGLGDIGDKVSLRPNEAYYKLLLPGLAVYASPENLAKYSKEKEEGSGPHFSSPNVEKIMSILSKVRLSVVMNKNNPWIIEPWHIRMSCRKAGIIIPEHAIELPEQPIRGPDMNIEGKYFPVVVTINNKEKVTMLCFIHHWSNKPDEKVWVERFWELPKEPVFPPDTTTTTTTTSPHVGAPPVDS